MPRKKPRISSLIKNLAENRKQQPRANEPRGDSRPRLSGRATLGRRRQPRSAFREAHPCSSAAKLLATNGASVSQCICAERRNYQPHGIDLLAAMQRNRTQRKRTEDCNNEPNQNSNKTSHLCHFMNCHPVYDKRSEGSRFWRGPAQTQIPRFARSNNSFF